MIPDHSIAPIIPNRKAKDGFTVEKYINFCSLNV